MDINERIELFRQKLESLYQTQMQNTPNAEPKITLEYGKKYVRVVVSTWGSRSVYCFIDQSNGDILKAANWKTPVKGARGNIFNENCDVGSRADVYGSGLYIRR